MSETMTAAEYRASIGLPPPGADAKKGPPIGMKRFVRAARLHEESKQDKPQIRVPRQRKQSKTETEYLRLLQSEFPGKQVLFEPMAFRLPSGTFYSADAVVMDGATIIMAVEIKGPRIQNSASVLHWKEARAAFPLWRWRFAQKRNGEWTIAE